MTPNEKNELMKLTKANLVDRLEMEQEYNASQVNNHLREIGSLRDQLKMRRAAESEMTGEIANLEALATKLTTERNKALARLSRAKRRIANYKTAERRAGPEAFEETVKERDLACEQRDKALEDLDRALKQGQERADAVKRANRDLEDAFDELGKANKDASRHRRDVYALRKSRKRWVVATALLGVITLAFGYACVQS